MKLEKLQRKRDKLAEKLAEYDRLIEVEKRKTEALHKMCVGSPELNAGSVKVEASVPGRIIKVCVRDSDFVKKGDVLMIIDSMKMELEILAPASGRVASVIPLEGTDVTVGELVAVIDL
jgi:biotin carboxyl carrier protein